MLFLSLSLFKFASFVLGIGSIFARTRIPTEEGERERERARQSLRRASAALRSPTIAVLRFLDVLTMLAEIVRLHRGWCHRTSIHRSRRPRARVSSRNDEEEEEKY